MNERIKNLKDEMRKKNIDGIIVSNPQNVKYLTGLLAEGILIVKLKENLFLTDSRYVEEVQKILTIDDEITVINIGELSKYDYENLLTLCNNVGFEEKYVTYEKYQNYLQLYQTNLVETEGIVEKLRQIKDEAEIENIKKACQITDNCFEYIIKYIKKGMTEKAIAFEMERYMRINGAEGIAFDFCVASGENSSMPHARPSSRRIKYGDVLLLDIGCKVNGYCSDFTRTVVIGEATDKFKEEYEFVLNQQEKLIELLKPEKEVREIVKQIYINFEEKNYPILHAFGHGVGMDIHEMPILSTKREYILKNNMVLAVEPGIYKTGEYGIRIEDTILLTENGSILLTKSEKNLIEIKL